MAGERQETRGIKGFRKAAHVARPRFSFLRLRWKFVAHAPRNYRGMIPVTFHHLSQLRAKFFSDRRVSHLLGSQLPVSSLGYDQKPVPIGPVQQLRGDRIMADSR